MIGKVFFIAVIYGLGMIAIDVNGEWGTGLGLLVMASIFHSKLMSEL